MDARAILMLLIALVALPAVVVLIEFRVQSRLVRAGSVLVALLAAIILAWAVRSVEVRGTSYLHREQFGMTLYNIQQSLERGSVAEVRTALATNAAAGWFQTPSMAQINSLREYLETAKVRTNRSVAKQ